MLIDLGPCLFLNMIFLFFFRVGLSFSFNVFGNARGRLSFDAFETCCPVLSLVALNINSQPVLDAHTGPKPGQTGHPFFDAAFPLRIMSTR